VLLKSFDIPEFFRKPEYSNLNFWKLSLLKNEFPTRTRLYFKTDSPEISAALS
jgi:hypothetical protein